MNSISGVERALNIVCMSMENTFLDGLPLGLSSFGEECKNSDKESKTHHRSSCMKCAEYVK